MIDIGAGAIPSYTCIRTNAHALARYAALCQEQDIVPIVEPEVLMDGAHSLERCEEVTEAVLQTVFDQLYAQRIDFEGMVLKPNMVISGKQATQQANPKEVAEATVGCLKRHVPPAVAGIAFLSGGQSPTEATQHLSLEGLERSECQRRRRAEGTAAARQAERACHERCLCARHGNSGGLMGHCAAIA